MDDLEGEDGVLVTVDGRDVAKIAISTGSPDSVMKRDL